MTPFACAPIDRAIAANDRSAFETYGIAPDGVRSWLAQGTLFVNDVYQVALHELVNGGVHLAIRRLDGAPARVWEELQAIKNALVGAESEALELYPGESRRSPTVHTHLWCQRSAQFRFPFGFDVLKLVSKGRVAGSMDFAG